MHRAILAIAGLAAAVGIAVAAGAPTPPPPTAATMPPVDTAQAAQFLKLVNQDVDDALRQIGARQDASILDGGRPMFQNVVRGPGGRVALAWSKECPEGRRFAVLVVSEGKPGENPRVEIFSDALIAHRIDRMEWSKGGDFLAILTRNVSLDAPGGQLAVLLVGVGQMHLIDRDVTQFSLAPSGRHLLYERSKEPGALDGPHVIVHSDGALGQKRVIHEIAHPKLQVREIGVLDETTGRASITIRDYSRGLASWTDSAATIDLIAGRVVAK